MEPKINLDWLTQKWISFSKKINWNDSVEGEIVKTLTPVEEEIVKTLTPKKGKDPLDLALWTEPLTKEEKFQKYHQILILPSNFPDYACTVNDYFKTIRINWNSEMMKKIDKAYLKMREEWIIEITSKNRSVYTTVKFPNEKPIHFLEPNFAKYSDNEYCYCMKYNLWEWVLSKYEARWDWMQWNIDEWKNEKLKQYVKQSWLNLQKKECFEWFMKKLADFVNKKYKLDIVSEEDRMGLFCRVMNSCWEFLLADYVNGSRLVFVYEDCKRWYRYGKHFNSPSSFFLTDYEG